jgi:hypothetical protein
MGFVEKRLERVLKPDREEELSCRAEQQQSERWRHAQSGDPGGT